MSKLFVYVVTRDGRKTLYELDHFGTVGQLKARIGLHMTVPMGFSRLTYKGLLLDNQSVLEEVGVKRMSTLLLYWQPLVFTPKQLREREDELDKLEEMQRAGESTAQETDQDQESGALSPGSTKGSKLQLSLASLSCCKLPEMEMEDLEEVTSISSSELDFLAIYRRPKNGNKSDELAETEEEPIEPNDNLFGLSADLKPIEPKKTDQMPLALPSKDPMAVDQEMQQTSDPQTSEETNHKKNAKSAKKIRKNK